VAATTTVQTVTMMMILTKMNTLIVDSKTCDIHDVRDNNDQPEVALSMLMIIRMLDMMRNVTIAMRIVAVQQSQRAHSVAPT
jgi:hypothetical protein